MQDPDLRFAVVITDGHVTGNPCGGIKVAAEHAREKDIRIFAVGASRKHDEGNVDETGLREIANSPESVYRKKYTAVDLRSGKAVVDRPTIDRIIRTMVMHRHTHRNTQRHTHY